MKFFLTYFFVSAFFCSSAQFLQDVTGQPYLQKSLDEYEGSPMLFPGWIKVNVTTSKGVVYQNMLVNIDLLQELLIFLKDEKIYTFSEDITEFKIADSSSSMLFKRGHSISPGLPNSLLEVISQLPVIVKKYDRSVIEVPTYGSSNKKFRYADVKSYYAAIDNSYKKIALTKENAQKVFTDKWAEIEAYAKQNNLSFKAEEGWRSVAAFYGSIKK